jgi:hypothetical protein
MNNINFAPELLPMMQEPLEVQELRKLGKANREDMQEWIETAIEVLPEITTEIQKI